MPSQFFYGKGHGTAIVLLASCLLLISYEGINRRITACVMEKKQPKIPGEEGLHDVRLMLVIYRAAESRDAKSRVLHKSKI